MSEDVARVIAQLDAMHRRMDRIECSIDRYNNLLGERDTELHTMLRDMEVTRARNESQISQCQSGLQKLLEKHTEVEEEHDLLVNRVENMSLVFSAARWALNIAVPVLVSAAAMMVFKLGDLPL